MSIKGKILVVDDDAIIATLLQSKLSERGYEITTASNGKEGLQKYLLTEPDLIILDIFMPEMDGYTFVQEFQKIGDLKETPIVILTAQESLKDIFAIEGINDYIVKPFDMELLFNKIDKRLASKVRKVLVVDDAKATNELITSILETRCYDVASAFDGFEGLETAKRDRPDLMILDVMLPQLDGYQICRMLKFDKDYRDIPIVLLTARDEREDQLLGANVGAEAYLTKPLDSDDLLHTMKRLLWD